MDVSFTNVLEGARQYFQGLPAAGAAAQPPPPTSVGGGGSPYFAPVQEGCGGSNHQSPAPPTSAAAAAYWPAVQQNEMKRAPSRETTPVQRPSSHSSDGSRPPSHSQYMHIAQDQNRQYKNPYQDQHGQQSSPQSFQFPRPQSREQYQPHISRNSPYHQPSSPQIPRVPSREQIVQPARSETYQLPQQTQHLTQNWSSHSNNYNEPQGHAYATQQKENYNNFQRSYSTVQNSAGNTSGSYTSQTYSTPSQSIQNSYMKQVYTSQNLQNEPTTSSSTNSSFQLMHSSADSLRNTHNLPPIAAISNYYSGRVAREIPRNIVQTSGNTVNMTSRQNGPETSTSSIIQNNQRQASYPSSTISNLSNNQRTCTSQGNQNHSFANTATTQSYNSVIVTTNTSSYYTSTYNQSQSSNNSYYQNIKQNITYVPVKSKEVLNSHTNQSYVQQRPVEPQHTSQNTNNERLQSVAKQKRESPLDLSVKTVRTPADSTLEESEAVNKYYSRTPASTVSSLSTHNYPTLDVNSIQRNFTQRSLTSASAPKVEFRPNFNVSSIHNVDKSFPKQVDDPRKPIIPNRVNSNVVPEYMTPAHHSLVAPTGYPSQSFPTVAHGNSYVQGNASLKKSIPKQDYTMNNSKINPYPLQNHEVNRKRPGDGVTSVIPSKLPKADNWRQSIDLQIEQKLSSYEQEQKQRMNAGQSSLLNGNYQPMIKEGLKDVDRFKDTSKPKEYNYNKTNYEQMSQYQSRCNPAFSTTPTSYNQSYVTAATSTPQHHGYTQLSHPYVNNLAASSRSLSNSSLSQKNSSPGVDKRVISLLRNSLEVKGQRKHEQLNKYTENVIQPRLEVQHPSTDVSAPLQPKSDAFTGRNNVSPFTPTSFPENSLVAAQKFQMQNAASANCDQDAKTLSKLQSESATVINSQPNNSGEYDGLAAAFLAAARIRTKAELKQLASSQNNGGVVNDKLQEALDKQEISPSKKDIQAAVVASNTEIVNSVKLSKDNQVKSTAPRKRLFSRNEDDTGSSSMPPREKSGFRSSSETSVFDFPDSDSENEMPVLERQSLEAMRRDRKSMQKQTITAVSPGASEKEEEEEKEKAISVSPEDDIFEKACENFMQELKNGSKIKVKKVQESYEKTVKTELMKEDVHESTVATNTSDITSIQIKQEVNEIEDSSQNPVIELPSDSDGKRDSVLESLSVENKIKTEQNDVDHSKQEFIENKNNVRRRLLTSDDSSGDEETNEPKKLNNTVIEPTRKASLTDEIIVKSEPLDKIEDQKSCTTPTKTSESKDTEATDTSVEIQPARPVKKPSFGDGSDFYPGWEEGVYRYKKSLRIPPSLIQVTKAPSSMRLSTSLPDLDPCPQSPTTSIITDNESKDSPSLNNKKTLKKIKSEPVDSDDESSCSFNVFSKINYDSEGSASITSLPNTKKESQSIIDKLLERYAAGRKRKKYKRKDDHSPKIIPKPENPVELLPTPSLELNKTRSAKETKKLKTPVIKTESPVLEFRKDTINNFKDAFMNSSKNLLGVHDKFAAVVLKSRTRKESRVLKQRATIKEVFGEDRPASAPPVTCVDNLLMKQEEQDKRVFSVNLENVLIKKEVIDNELKSEQSDNGDKKDSKRVLKNRLLDKNKDKQPIANLKTGADRKIKTEVEDETEDDNSRLDDEFIKKDIDCKSETPSLEGDDMSLSGRRRNRISKFRRKFSSGFDYLRKKKKVKKENIENESGEKKEKKRRSCGIKTLESIDDIQKEIKTWVLNKGIGETHLHRAARLGYTDVVAYCLETMECQPSPKDNAGYTPLHEACARGHLDIAKLLLKYSANIHESAQGGIRPLHEAVDNNYIEIVRLLLSYGADPSLATYAGKTPLELASSEDMKSLLINHMKEIKGEAGTTWYFHGPASFFDPIHEIGYDMFEDVPDPDELPEEDDIELEITEMLLPNLYTLRGEPSSDRWVILQDLSSILKIKSRDALLRQICPPSTSSAQVNYSTVLRELKMTDFLEQARCCQFLNQGEKLNTRASKIALVKYTDKVKELLGIENVVVTSR